MRLPRALTLLGLAAVLVLAAGCGTSDKAATTDPSTTTTTSTAAATSTSADPTTTSSSSTTAAPTSAAATTTAASTTTAPDGDPARCKASQLNVTAGNPNGGAGHVGVAVIWENSSSTPCLMTGWAGADGLDDNGASATHAERTDSGYLGGVQGQMPRIVLRPGDRASSLVEGTSVPTGDATECPTYSGLLVTPPEDTTSVKLDVILPGCSGLQIHPVVAGTTGTQG